MTNRLPSWKGKFLTKAGRLKLVNLVLSSISTYFLTIFEVKKWAIRKFDKITRNFLWKGAESANGGALSRLVGQSSATKRLSVANMASYAISSSMILVILDNMINGTNHIV
jgi:hypothetical protein